MCRMGSGLPTVAALGAVVDRTRFDLFIERLQEAAGQQEVAQYVRDLPDAKARTWAGVHGSDRIAVAEEARVIEDLCRRFQAFPLLRDAGRESFHSVVGRLRPVAPGDAGSHSLLSWIPAYVSFFHSQLSVQVEPGSPGRFDLHLFYAQSSPESLIDFLFWRSFISALLAFFGFRDFELAETKTMLAPDSIPASVFPQPSLGYSADHACLSLAIPMKQLETRVDALIDPGPSGGSDMNARFVDDVMRRSAAILRDKRELMTAVEFLNVANNTLEREILANKRELNMARNIQKGFVPRRIPDWNGLQFWVKFYPLTEVSGDFYDYFTIGSNKLGLMVCDVSGHGVPAALIGAIAKLSFNSHRYDSPAEVFARVNMDIHNYVKTEGYLTCFYMLADADYNVTYSVAAVPAPLLLRKRTGEVEKLQGRGTLIGMFPDAGKHFEDHEVRLEPGDKLFIFTDGLTEAQNARGELLGEQRLIEVVKETFEMDLKASSEHVIEYYNRFHLGTDPGDDLTLITVSLSEQVQEFQDHLSRVRHLAEQLHDPAAAVEELRLAHAIFPSHTGVLYMLAKLLRRVHRFEEAIAFFDEYNSLRPYNADSYRLLGECNLNLGHLGPARVCLERSLSLRPENPSALYLMGRLNLRMNLLDEAEGCLKALKEMRPHKKKTRDLEERIRGAGFREPE